MSKAETVWLTEDSLPELGEFLRSAFTTAEHQFAFTPEMLRWKYLEPSGFGCAARSLLVRENGRIVAHVGLYCTEFGGTSAMHPYDWVASGTKSPHGYMVLRRAQQASDIHYVFGCTPAAAQVFEAAGYRVAATIPLFQKILDPIAWRHIHQQQPFLKKAILLALDRSRSVLHTGRVPALNVELRQVSEFGSEIEELLRKSSTAIRSSRAPRLLNYYLRYPPGTIRGWHVAVEGRLRGFALTNTNPHGAVSRGKILDVCLDAEDTDLGAAVIAAIVNELRTAGCQHVSAYAGISWLAAALRANGFFERGHTKVHWRDAKNKIALDKPFHLTYLEADTGLL